MLDYDEYDATALAELVRSKQVKPAELVEAAIERIEARNGDLNAVIIKRYEAARAEAAEDVGSGPFAGVPFLLKDIGANQAGLPYYAGSRALKGADYRDRAGTFLGERFRAAGFITVGKTNLPELGTCPTTQPLSFGPTNNPWDVTRSPAGSSGGSAAAVAARIVPVAHANDGGGSTRLPAAWCGLVGLKTTRGRMPQPLSISRLGSELVVSRTVRDTAAVLDATHGATDADLYRTALPERPYVRELTADPGRLRVAMLTKGGGIEVDGACVEGVERTARVLREMGHEIEVVDGGALFGGDGSVNGTLWMAGITRGIDHLAELLGRAMTADDIEPYNWTAAERGRSISASEWTKAQEIQQAWAASVIEWFSPYDVLLSPTAGCPPLKTEDLWPDPERPWRMGRTYGRIGRFTLPFNATGQPAISLPLHWTADGLPVGIQLVAKMGREDLLIRLAARLEEAMPWKHRKPALLA